MFFQKNLPTWERALRVCVGLAVGIAALAVLIEPLVKWAVLAGGVMFAGTGFIGFCPACAMFGRKLKRENQS